MRHDWKKQLRGDVKCVVCGTSALVPNDKECSGTSEHPMTQDTNTRRAKPCCGDSATKPSSRPVTRKSCRECVEKHLGAALVLLGELRLGYAYRLRVIGHLHEAEDESQEWTVLHDAIRAARKAFQKDGRIPNFEQLAALLLRADISPA